jgi:hypothetical protein
MKCIECKNYTVKQYKKTINIIKVCAVNKDDLRVIVDINPINCKDYYEEINRHTRRNS